ncbi:hypothetical protein BK726_27395 [Bacillus thuringiensis serovar londrina]|uniref:DUF2971 domain-containing protein n=1 Tax=Bacillus thuringiensis TaxID=1428 RepID=UPI000B4396CB|nr:DUF2971 domain-containing protein [Bacillus thuringiensis]OTX80801.1 hypothetical protein BK726_27395 [Bacillus thuringiensis serovar londrina]
MSEKLYHYTSLNTALKYIIPSGKLRLGRIEYTNDPRETKEWRLSIRLSGDVNDVPFEELQRRFNMEKRKARLLCFSQNQSEFLEDDAPAFSHYKILREGYCRLRMWANYAENHKGICLEFDKELLISSINEQLCGKGVLYNDPVKYTNYSTENIISTSFDLKEIQTEGLDKVIDRHLSEFYRHVFFEKLLDWRDEAEYRFLHIPVDQDGDTYVDITNALTNIYVGINYDYSNNKELMEILDKVKYPILDEPKQLHIRNSQPHIAPLIF